VIVVTTLAGLLAGLALALASAPWLFWAVGCVMRGDGAAGDRAMEASPLYRYFVWVEAR
jgi:hypothetical protein